MDATTVAVCDLEDQIASEMGFSETSIAAADERGVPAEMERKRQMRGRLREDGPAPPSIGKTEPATCAGAGPG